MVRPNNLLDRITDLPESIKITYGGVLEINGTIMPRILWLVMAAMSLWMPIGVVVCVGTLFTLPLMVTVLPIVHRKVYGRGKA